MAEDHTLASASVLVVDLRSVFRRDRCQAMFSLVRAGGCRSQRLALAATAGGSAAAATMAAPPMRTSRRDGKLFPVESCLVTVSFLSAAIRSHSVEPGCKLCEALFFSALLSGDPLTNVGRTMEEFDAF